jgi:hypothetical protein
MYTITKKQYLGHWVKSIVQPAFTTAALSEPYIWYDLELIETPELELSENELLEMESQKGGTEKLEDSIIIASGLLPLLVERARETPPSYDWKRDLYEL